MPFRLSERRAAWLILGLIGLIYLTCSLYSIPTQEIEKDEFITSRVMRIVGFGPLLHERLVAGHVPLYFLALKGWTALFGATQTPLILFSSLLGLLTIPAIWWLARELGLGRWAYAAAALLAAQPAFQFFAHFVRPYSGALLLQCLILATVFRLLRRSVEAGPRPSARLWVLACTLAIVGAAWNHLLMVTWGCLLVALLVLPRLRRHASPGVWAVLLLALAAHGAWVLAIRQTVVAIHRDPLSWIKPIGVLDSLDEIFKILAGRELSFAAFKSYHLAGIFLVLALGWVAWRQLRALRPAVVEVSSCEGGLLPALWLTLILTAILPLAVMLAMNQQRPVLVERYLLPILPAFLLCGVRVLKGLRPGWVRVGCLGVLAVLWAAESQRVLERRQTGLRASVERLEQVLEPARDGVVAFTQTVGDAIALYSHRPLDVYQTGSPYRYVRYMRALEPYLTRHARIWVISYRERSGVLNSGPWNQRMGPAVQVEKFDKTRLALYFPPPPTASGTTSATQTTSGTAVTTGTAVTSGTQAPLVGDVLTSATQAEEAEDVGTF